MLDIVRRRLSRAWNGGRQERPGEGGYGRSTWEAPSSSYRPRSPKPVTRYENETGDEEDQAEGSTTGDAGSKRREGGGPSMVQRRSNWSTGGVGGFAKRGRSKAKPVPLALRIIFSVFPFMKYWGGFL
mmetsp:Transcript_9516/g.27066  ORF Transcript_9516/g.27066 Transcript_9516/m.27066 type:complete len:128 (-) Transcript_9516:150-533(-)